MWRDLDCDHGGSKGLNSLPLMKNKYLRYNSVLYSLAIRKFKALTVLRGSGPSFQQRQ